MKIRIKGNSIRFRLTKKEVGQFHETGFLEERTLFPFSQTFVYALSTGDAVGAEFQEGKITVRLPKNQLEEWCNTDLVTCSFSLSLKDDERLEVLVEKDFHCMQPRAGEDESDHYPNPNQVKQ